MSSANEKCVKLIYFVMCSHFTVSRLDSIFMRRELMDSRVAELLGASTPENKLLPSNSIGST